MKKLVFLFLILFSTIGFAQKNSFGIFISPNTSFRKTTGKDYEKDISKKSSFIDFGFNYKRVVAKNISITTGLNISNRGFDYKPLLVINGFVYSTHHTLAYLELPIGGSYSLLNKKSFRINLGANFINQLLLQSSFKPYDFHEMPWYMGGPEHITPKETTIKYSDLNDAGYRKYNYAIGGIAEIQFKLIHNVWISLLPTYKYSLKASALKTSDYDAPHQHLYSWGAEVRASYEF